MGIAGAITRLGGQTATVQRRAASSMLNGRVVAGTSTTIPLTASIQPSTPRELLRLPEGLRTKQTITVVALVALRTADEAAGTPPDVITYEGSSYEVQSVESWSFRGTTYWRALATRI